MKELSQKQSIQENQYAFPYHHIPYVDQNGFSQIRSLRWGFEYLSYILYVTERVRQIDFTTLLDVGCGDGKFLLEASRILEDKCLEGIDYSERAIAFARLFSPNVTFCVGDITKSKDTPRELYDVITLIETLEHIPPNDIPAFLKGIGDHLKDDGYFIITVPSTNRPTDTKHYQHFTRKTLEETLQPYFRIAECQYLNKTGFEKTFLTRLLDNRLFALKNRRIAGWLFNYYRKHWFLAAEQNGERVFAICKKLNGVDTVPNRAS